jgi:hypothetical protein
MPMHIGTPPPRHRWFRDLLIAVVSAVITASVQYGVLEVERDRLAFERRKFGIEKEEKGMELLRTSEQKNLSLASDLRGKYRTVFFSNKCKSSINVAVRYQTLDSFTHVSGWFVLKPAERFGPLNTQADWIEVFQSNGNGKEIKGDQIHAIDDGDKFDYLDDMYFPREWFPLKQARQVGFTRRPLEQKSGDTVLSLSCLD